MVDWMRALADYYASVREHYPGDELLIVFDIDGAILDAQARLHAGLVTFDREHGTDFFYGLNRAELAHGGLRDVMRARGLSAEERAWVRLWYERWRSSPEALLAAHKPHQGIMDMIRWFQLQPRTHVGLNASRPESARDETLRSLNALGREYRVRFSSDLMLMCPGGDARGQAAARAQNLRAFRRSGYRIVAVIDARPDHRHELVAVCPEEVLFLDAGALFAERRGYDITRLIGARDLPRHVRFVYRGVEAAGGLERFLAAEIEWAEVDVRFDPRWQLVARREDFEQRPWSRDEALMTLPRLLEALERSGKRLKLDLTLGGVLVERTIALLREFGWSGERLWFNGEIDALGEDGFAQLAREFPEATLQCPVDFLGPLAFAMPDQARAILARLQRWGINRASIAWETPRRDALLSWLQEEGWDVNVYDVPDLEAFLHTVLALPSSLTSSFDLSDVW